MTIGERIDKLVEEYYQLYIDLGKRDHKDPRGLALYDLVMKKLIYTEAIEILEKKIGA